MTDQPYVSPQEKLNNSIISSPAADGGTDFRAEVAKGVFLTALATTFENNKMITPDMTREMAVIAVDCADVLIERLAKGRK